MYVCIYNIYIYVYIYNIFYINLYILILYEFVVLILLAFTSFITGRSLKWSYMRSTLFSSSLSFTSWSYNII